MGYSPWGHKESDITEQLSTHKHTHVIHQARSQAYIWTEL